MEFARRRRKEPGRWLVLALLAVVLAEAAWAALDEGGIEIPANVNSTDVRSPVKDIHVRRRPLPAGLSEVRACQNWSGSLLAERWCPCSQQQASSFLVPRGLVGAGAVRSAKRPQGKPGCGSLKLHRVLLLLNQERL